MGRPASSSRIRALTVAAALWLATPTAAGAQGRVLVKGIVDLEGWTTDSGSRLLTRNGGRPSMVGRVTAWGAAEVFPRVQLFALAEVESETGSGEPTEVGIEQLGIRYIRSPALVIEAGKTTTLVGAFANRRFSTTNPLIGRPDSYDVSYPLGAIASGTWSIFDYRVGLVSLPVVNRKYVPEAGSAARPAMGIGVTPTIGFRIGASYTAGPYLNANLGAAIPANADWKSYHQRILGIDARFGRGHFESRGELARSWYDVPNRADPIPGTAGYLELKQTWRPRLFTAVRVEGNDYPFIRPRPTGDWTATAVTFFNAELAVGYRIDPLTLIKVGYRRDHWAVEPALKGFFPNGYALALQISRRLDLLD